MPYSELVHVGFIGLRCVCVCVRGDFGTCADVF